MPLASDAAVAFSGRACVRNIPDLAQELLRSGSTFANKGKSSLTILHQLLVPQIVCEEVA